MSKIPTLPTYPNGIQLNTLLEGTQNTLFAYGKANAVACNFGAVAKDTPKTHMLADILIHEIKDQRQAVTRTHREMIHIYDTLVSHIKLLEGDMSVSRQNSLDIETGLRKEIADLKGQLALYTAEIAAFSYGKNAQAAESYDLRRGKEFGHFDVIPTARVPSVLAWDMSEAAEENDEFDVRKVFADVDDEIVEAEFPDIDDPILIEDELPDDVHALKRRIELQQKTIQSLQRHKSDLEHDIEGWRTLNDAQNVEIVELQKALDAQQGHIFLGFTATVEFKGK